MGAPSPKDETGLGKLISLAREIVENRFKSENPERMDMLGKSTLQIQSHKLIYLQQGPSSAMDLRGIKQS